MSKIKNKDFENLELAEVFANYPPKFRTKLMYLRQLIFDTAEKIEDITNANSGLSSLIFLI